MKHYNPNTETCDDIVKLLFDFSTEGVGRERGPASAHIKENQHNEKTNRSLADSMREGAIVTLTTLEEVRKLPYEFRKKNEEVLIDFSKIACAVRLPETEVKTDE